VPVVSDLEGKCVLSAVDDRTRGAVDTRFAAIPAESRKSVEVVVRDVWRPYMNAAARWPPNARVCFDRFRMVRHLGHTVNTAHQQEHRRLSSEGDRRLAGTKHPWLESSAPIRPERRSVLSQLKDIHTRTGRACALTESAARLWDYASNGWTRKAWLAGAALASRSRLKTMARAARMARSHLEGS
jgi:transposase